MKGASAAFRALTRTETAVLEKLLEHRFPGRDALYHQLAGLRAKEIDANGSLRFQVTANTTTPIRRSVVAEVRYPDLDTKNESDPHVNILLHVLDGKLSIMEIYKDDGSTIMRRPDPSLLRLTNST
jgi:hypothetical protein